MGTTSKNKTLFEDYDGFVEKFKPKKTTDDCYTPPAVYEAVVKWVNDEIMSLDGKRILRPFYPGGDYENEIYPDNCVVIDNPPFSIVSKICRFYTQCGIPYFLFAPALTLFSTPNEKESYIVAHADITYENGAVVRTSFRTNMLEGSPKLLIRGSLFKIIKNAQSKEDKRKRILGWPDNVVNAGLFGKICSRGIDFDVMPEDCHFVRKLDCGRTLFGAGYLLSERAAAERAAAERAAAERAAAERAAAERAAAERAAAEYAVLSDREREIIARLGHG